MKIKLDLYGPNVLHYSVMRKEAKMKVKSLKERVFNLTAEVEATGSLDGVVDLMREVKDSNEVVEFKLKMIKSLKKSASVAVGNSTERDFNGYELSRSPYGRK